MARHQGFDIPTVEEVLKWSRGKIKLDVELKEEGYEKEIVELLSGYFEEDQFVITSFNDASLRVIKERYPRYQNRLNFRKRNTLLSHSDPTSRVLPHEKM